MSMQALSAPTLRNFHDSHCRNCTQKTLSAIKNFTWKKEATSIGIGSLTLYSFGLLPAIGTTLLVYGIFRFVFSPKTKISRSYPQLNRNDTFMGDQSAHGVANVFEDEEIIEVHKALRTEVITNEAASFNSNEKETAEKLTLVVSYSTKNKPFFQQKGVRSCSTATAAMLILDHGKKPDFSSLTYNLRNEETIIRLLTQAGLRAIKTKIESLQELHKAIQAHGSAIISISDDEIGGHSIIVDAVSSVITIREPYHGVNLDISNVALVKRIFARSGPITIIQAV